MVNKQKKLNEANVLIIDRSTLTSSGIGTNTLNDGLTFITFLELEFKMKKYV